MSAGAILRVQKLKGSGRLRAAAAHNLRAIQAELGAGSHIDASRIALNLHLAGPIDPQAVATLAEDRMTAAGIGTLRKDAVRAIEFVVSLPVGAGVDERSFFTSAMHWLAANFGGANNIMSADVHRDEAAPHMHLLLLPLIGGRMVGSDAVGGRTKLRALQDGFFRDVGAPHGLKRYTGHTSVEAKRRAVTAVMKELEGLRDTALKSKLWPLIRDHIAAAPGPFAELLGLEVTAPSKPKRPRTMTDIFISSGKGPKRELDPRNPIGFALHAAKAPEVEPYAL